MQSSEWNGKKTPQWANGKRIMSRQAGRTLTEELKKFVRLSQMEELGIRKKIQKRKRTKVGADIDSCNKPTKGNAIDSLCKKPGLSSASCRQRSLQVRRKKQKKKQSDEK